MCIIYQLWCNHFVIAFSSYFEKRNFINLECEYQYNKTISKRRHFATGRKGSWIWAFIYWLFTFHFVWWKYFPLYTIYLLDASVKILTCMWKILTEVHSEYSLVFAWVIFQPNVIKIWKFSFNQEQLSNNSTLTVLTYLQLTASLQHKYNTLKASCLWGEIFGSCLI